MPLYATRLQQIWSQRCRERMYFTGYCKKPFKPPTPQTTHTRINVDLQNVGLGPWSTGDRTEAGPEGPPRHCCLWSLPTADAAVLQTIQEHSTSPARLHSLPSPKCGLRNSTVHDLGPGIKVTTLRKRGLCKAGSLKRFVTFTAPH